MSILYSALASLIAIVLHEVSHGYISYRLGDPTPKEEGRLTLNPVKHIDPLGIILLIVCHVGWAKPVRINPMYYRHPKRDIALVSLAGPLMNFILAFVFSFFTVLLNKLEYTYLSYMGYYFCYYCVIINIGLGIFNLIPIPPLDGSKVLAAFLPDKAYIKFMSYEKYGMYFIFILVFIMNILSNYGMPSLLSDGVSYISNVFISFWESIIG